MKSKNASIGRLKCLCLQEQFGRATKVFVFSKELHVTMNEIKKFHRKEKQPDQQIDQDANTNPYQFDEASFFFHIKSSSKITATGPPKCIPSMHLLHAVFCAAPDQSKRAISMLRKFSNLASRGHRIRCSYSL